MTTDNRSGTCVTGKVRYENDQEAAVALERVQAARAERPDGHPPERIFYACRAGCGGWHLSSQPPSLGPEHAAKGDGETWEEYAHRLEQRVKEQRDVLAAINVLRADAGNRHERKRIEHLTFALGRMTERWEKEKAAKMALLAMRREGIEA